MQAIAANPAARRIPRDRFAVQWQRLRADRARPRPNRLDPTRLPAFGSVLGYLLSFSSPLLDPISGRVHAKGDRPSNHRADPGEDTAIYDHAKQ